jgi:diguanylate cyclase (GGDEF)-like protein
VDVGTRILVVDDDSAMRLLLRQILEQDGHVVEEAEDGEAALCMFERNPPDVVLLDAMMPGMDGFTVCARLRRMFNSANVAIVMTTALTDESSIAQAFDAGATDYTTKPVNPVLLRHRLNQTIAASRRQAHIEHLAHYDPLTRLANRTRLLDRLQYALAHAKRTRALVGLLYCDIDGFKTVNDTFGHSIGDLVLSRIGDRLASLVRSCDTAARLGGDEFILLVTAGVSQEGIEIVAQKILRTVSASLSLAEGPDSISVSVGAAVYPTDGDDARTLLEKADAAMYDAKQSGGNAYRLCLASEPTPADMPSPVA